MSNYFSQLPNFEYISRINERQTNSDFLKVKNLFRRAIIREDIFTDFMAFTKYKIIGDMRPDAVAYEVYGDEDLDWVILASNKDIFLTPAMNVRMWEHPSTKENLNKLKSFGYKIIGPEIGDMACGEFGEGKMTEPEYIITYLNNFFSVPGIIFEENMTESPSSKKISGCVPFAIFTIAPFGSPWLPVHK